MSKKDLLSQCREALGDATLTNLDLLNLIGEMKKELENESVKIGNQWFWMLPE